MRAWSSFATSASSRARRSANGSSRRSVVAFDQQIVGAQMRGKFGQQLRVHGLAVEPLLQHVERLHAAVAQDQQLAVDRAVEVQRVGQIGKRAGDILAGARIEPRDALAVGFAGDRLHADAVPFPFGGEVRGIERGESPVSSIAWLSITGRNGAGSTLTGFSARPSIQANSSRVGRREAVPHQLDLVRLLVAERRDRGLGEPRRHADAQRAGDELQQRPAPGLVERIEPGGELRRELGFAERGEGGDDVGARVLPASVAAPLPRERGARGEPRRGGWGRCSIADDLETPHPRSPPPSGARPSPALRGEG